jgi:endonuclease/exonuclease/phosphatase (EEP) superfamily protein YafD
MMTDPTPPPTDVTAAEQGSDAPAPVRRWQRLHVGAIGIGVVGLMLWSTGQLLRDRWWLSGICFYLPSPVLATWLLALAGIALRTGQRRRAVLLSLLALPPVVFMLALENQWRRPATAQPAPAAGALRVVHWNVCRGALGWSRIRDRLVDERADLYVLSEASRNRCPLAELCAELGDDYTSVRESTLSAVARGEIKVDGWLVKEDRIKVAIVQWRPDDQWIKVMAVDLTAALRVHRQPQIRRLRALIAEHQPDLVVGDLNAPRRSLGLDQLPAGYAHAYRSAGAGSGYTWPVPLPVLAIDHLLHGERVAVHAYELDTNIASDHRLQRAVVSVAPAAR